MEQAVDIVCLAIPAPKPPGLLTNRTITTAIRNAQERRDVRVLIATSERRPFPTDMDEITGFTSSSLSIPPSLIARAHARAREDAAKLWAVKKDVPTTGTQLKERPGQREQPMGEASGQAVLTGAAAAGNQPREVPRKGDERGAHQ